MERKIILYPSNSTRRRDYTIYTHKQCAKCKEIKKCEDFRKEKRDRGHGWRYKSYCKQCMNIITKKIQMNIRRRKGIKEKILMPLEQRVEHQKKASRKHYYSHLKQERERTKQWKKDNIEKQRFMEKRRRARKRNAEGSHTIKEWELLKKQYGYMCPFCQQSEPEIKLTQDHIIPLNRGGSDYIGNMQPLCFSCNSSKHDKIINRIETYLLKFENE